MLTAVDRSRGVGLSGIAVRPRIVTLVALPVAFAALLILAPLAAAASRVIWDQAANSSTANVSGIFSAAPNGTGLKHLSSPTYPDTHSGPAGTPDGKQIIYTERVKSTGVGTLRIMDADGKNNKPLATDVYDAEFSSDGSKIVFIRYIASKPTIHTMNGDGTGVKSTGVQGYYPTYEPVGDDRIAFSGSPGDGGGNEIFLMNPNGSGVKQLTHTTGGSPWISATHPSFSPDGLELVFSLDVEQYGLPYPPGSHLMTIDVPDPDPDPGDPDPVLTDLTAGQPGNDGYDVQPSWSPDGDQIAFYSRRQGGLDTVGIYVMAATVGAPATPVHLTPSLNIGPSVNWLGASSGSDPTDSAACKKAKKKVAAAKKKLKKAKSALKKAKKKKASKGKIKRLKKQVKKAAKKYKKAKKKKKKKC